jgi:hypothetical protein
LLFLPLPFLQSPRNSNRPYRDLMPCTSPRLTRVKKGITNLRAPSMPTPQRTSSKGENSSSVLRPPTPTIQSSFFLFPFCFCFAHSHSRHCQLCNTTVPRSLPVTIRKQFKTQPTSWEKRSAAVARFGNPAGPRRFRDFISLHAEAVLYAVNPRPYDFLFH